MTSRAVTNSPRPIAQRMALAPVFQTDMREIRMLGNRQSQIIENARDFWVDIQIRVLTEGDVPNSTSFSIRAATTPGVGDGITPLTNEWTNFILAPGQVLYATASANNNVIQIVTQAIPAAEYQRTNNRIVALIEQLVSKQEATEKRLVELIEKLR